MSATEMPTSTETMLASSAALDENRCELDGFHLQDLHDASLDVS